MKRHLTYEWFKSPVTGLEASNATVGVVVSGDAVDMVVFPNAISLLELAGGVGGIIKDNINGTLSLAVANVDYAPPTNPIFNGIGVTFPSNTTGDRPAGTSDGVIIRFERIL